MCLSFLEKIPLCGGLAIGIKENFKPCLITEGDDDNEILTVEATVSDKNIRFITGYGNQETDNVQRRQNFFLS